MAPFTSSAIAPMYRLTEMMISNIMSSFVFGKVRTSMCQSVAQGGVFLLRTAECYEVATPTATSQHIRLNNAIFLNTLESSVT